MERSVYIRSIIAIVIRRTEMDKSREMAYVSTDKTDFEIHYAPRIYSFLVYFFDRNRSMKRSISIKRKYANTFKKINNMDRSMFKIYISWIKTKKKFRKQLQKNVTFSILTKTFSIIFVSYDHFCFENLKLIQKQVRIFNREIIRTIPELGEFSGGYAYVYHILTLYVYVY